MNRRSENTAILIFVRSLKEELAAKKLIKNDFNKNVKLFKALNKKVKHLAESTRLPVFIIDSTKQIGNSFEERYQNAFETVFNNGFEKVISLGNDVPNLQKNQFQDLVEALSYTDVAYGTTQENGLYALGLSNKAYRKLDFSNIKWQSTELLSSFKLSLELTGLNYFEHQTVLIDINNLTQLKLFFENKVIQSSIYFLFFSLIFPTVKRDIQKCLLSFLDLFRSSSLVHRGPPVVC